MTMTRAGRITLAMPVYNVEKYVERALLSALNQDYDNLDIVVVDDKGKDSSMDIVRRVVATHQRGKDVRIIEHESNMGLGATRNTAIDNAEGEYIIFMDSDDYITDDCISKLYSSVIDNGSDMVVGSFDEFMLSGGNGKVFRQVAGSKSGTDVLYEWISSPLVYVQSWNKLYKTDLLRRNNVRCIPSNRNEDVFFTFQLLKRVTSVSFVSDITYHYQTMNPEAITYNMATGVFDEKEHLQYVGILDSMLEYMREHNLSKDRFLNEYFLWFYRIRIGSAINGKGVSYCDKVRYMNQLRSLPIKSTDFPGMVEGVRRYGMGWLYSVLPARLSMFVYNCRNVLRYGNRYDKKI